MQLNTTVSTVNIPKPSRSCSLTYKINMLLVSPNERLNNIILERTIKYNTYPASKFHGKRIQRYLWDREHMETNPKVYMACSHAHMFVTCHVFSHVSITAPVYWPWHTPVKIKRGGHFSVLTGMWVFQNITLHRATNSAKSQVKIRLSFHFVERNNVIISQK